jgi:hypothetical protein
MPLANNALTTLEEVKKNLEIQLDDTSQDEFLIMKINGVSADIEDYTRRTISAEFVLPKDATMDKPQTLPCNLENACIEWVAVLYQKIGSEHLKTETIGPLKSEYILGMPDHIRQTLDRYREYVLV